MEVELHTFLTSSLDGGEWLASQYTYFTTMQMLKKNCHWPPDFWFVTNFLFSIREFAFVIQAISTDKMMNNIQRSQGQHN
jgi:hypothetical protein